MGQTPRNAIAGWYTDPSGRAQLRYWSGTAWTEWARNGDQVLNLPVGPPASAATGATSSRPGTASDAAHLDFVERTFLPRAQARGLLNEVRSQALAELVATMRREAGVARRPATTTAAVPVTQPGTALAGSPGVAREVPSIPAGTSAGDLLAAGGAPRRTAAPSTAPNQPRPTVVPPQGLPPTGFPPQATPRPAPPVRTGPSRWELLRERLGNELTVNGLAYLGVLLLFVGAFGLVAFAFGDVAPAMRPVAEIITAVVPFIGAWILLRSGARVAGRAVEVLGGLVVPLMGITSLVDGFPVPPNPTGIGLPIGATLVCLLSAAGAALWTGRHPESGLRLTVAPVLWLAAATATIGVGREMPQGEQVASITAPQTLAVALALLLTTALARLRPQHPLATPATAAALPGLTVVTVLALVTSVISSTPLLALGTAAALIATARLCRPGLSASAFDLVGPIVWGVVVGAAYASAAQLPAPGFSHHVGLVAALGAAGFVALVELARRDHRALLPHALAAAGLLLAVAATLSSDGWTWPVAIAVTAWALWRRAGAEARVRPPLEGVAATVPLVLLFSLADREVLGLSVAAALAVAATAVVRTGVLRTSPTDTFWLWWWRGAVAVTGVWSLLVAATSLPDGGDAPVRAWVAVGVLALALALVAIGPVPAVARPWILAAGGATLWHLVCVLLGTAPLWRTVVLAAAALAVSALGHVRRGERSDATVDGSTVAAGAALAVWAFASTGAVPGLSWASVVGVAAMLGAAAITALRHDAGASPFSEALGRSRLGSLPWSLTLLLLALLLSLALRLLGALGPQHAWQFTVPAVLALLAAAATRVPGLPRHLHGSLLPVSITLAATSLLSLTPVNAAVTAASDSAAPAGLWPAIASLATVTVLPLVLAPASRHPGLVWAGWIAAGPTAWLLLDQLRPAEGSATNAGWSFAVLGAGYLLGGALHHRSRPVPGQESGRGVLAPSLRSGAGAPFAVGGAFAFVAAVVALGLGRPGGWIAVVLAAAAVTVGILLRTGAWLAGGLTVGWCAVLGLAAPDLLRAPWLAALVALAVIVAALLLERPSQGRAPLHRWDATLALPAVVVGGSALVLASGRLGPLGTGPGGDPEHVRAAVTTAILGLTAVGAGVRLLTRPFSFRPATPRPTAAPTPLGGAPGLPVQPALVPMAPPVTPPGRVPSTPHPVLSTLGWCWELLVGLGSTLLLVAGVWYGGAAPGTVLAVIGAIYVARSLITAPPRRVVLQVIGTGALLAAWFVVLGHLDLTTAAVVDLTTVTGSLLTVAVALVLRRSPLPGALVAGAGVLALTGLGLVMGLLTGVNSGTAGEALGLLAASTPVVVAVAMGLVAGRVPGRWWRESAAAVVVVSARLIMDAGHVPAPTQVIGLSVGACVTVALVVLAVRRPGQAWAPALTLASTLATVLALAHAGVVRDAAGTDLGLLAVPVAAAALQAACLGLAWRRPGLVRLSPILACVTWLLLARWADLDGLQWYTAAIGLTLLGVVELWRRDLRRASTAAPVAPVVPPRPDAAPAGWAHPQQAAEPASAAGLLAALELAGIGFLLLGPLVQSLTDSPLHTLVGAAIGVALTLWGIATRIRRRVRTGVVAVLAFVSALVVIPLAQVLPELGSAGLWITIAVVGLLAVLVAALMERGRKAVRSGFARIWGDDPRWE